MSIATEITRLQTAKADLKTAIEGKGVTVPSATKIDGYADLVEAIQTGGGGMQISPLGYPFILQNGTTSARSCGYLSYSSTCIFQPEGGGAIAANGSVTKNAMATDGEHVWIRINNYTGSIKYNGVALDYVRDGSYFMVPIPEGFDGTIPFVIAG